MGKKKERRGVGSAFAVKVVCGRGFKGLAFTATYLFAQSSKKEAKNAF